MKNENATTIYVRTEKDVVETFDRLYPKNRSQFITCALRRACESQSFLIEVLYGKNV